MTNAGKGYPDYEQIVSHVRRYHDHDMSVIRKAYDFAEQAHRDQKRLSGEPYFSHPCEVAIILADLMMDPATIAAGLLHDCIEDVEGVTYEVIEKEFGSDIALMVDGVTKLSRMDFLSKEAQKAESIRKMFIAMAKEIRVVLIKLADRLHNMRTLDTQKPGRRQAIARETLDIYSPLAHRLGVYAVKSELEDLSLKYLEPEAYEFICGKVGSNLEEQENWINEIKQTLKDELPKHGITGFELSGRIKHTYSIYRKMKNQGKTFEQITDLVAVRVVVKTQQDCYGTLGVVHSIWQPVPARIKDYISMPKYGIYQSLHTTVIGKAGRFFEVQIRTEEMHRSAEYGIAAHWRYKEGRAADELDEKLKWLRQIVDWTNDAGDSEEFERLLKADLFQDEVLVLTPRNDIITLPKGATPIDFAYRIHSAVGNRCVGAKVNGKMVPLSTQLETADFVEIVTSQSSKGPSLDWLNIVKTGEARAKIRAFLKNASKDENMVRGRDMLEKEAKRLGYSYPELMKSEFLEVVFKRNSLSSVEDLFITVGFGGLSATQVINRLAEELKKTRRQETKLLDLAEKAQARKHTFSSQGVEVEGDPGMLIRFAHCCNPLPGDSIVGYVTTGRGVSVHRADCVNMQDENLEPGRMVNVSWAKNDQTAHEAEIEVRGYNSEGLLIDLSKIFNELDVPIVAVSARTLKNNTAQINMKLSINDTEQLNRLIRQISKRSDIFEVCRTGM